MTTFNISSAAGVDFGNYVANSEAEALDALAVDAGYANYDVACGIATGELIVTES